MSRTLFILVPILILAACGPIPTLTTAPTIQILSTANPMNASPQANEYSPQAGDETMKRDKVYIDSIQVVSLESSPKQIHLSIKGSLPTPCHHLRSAVNAPDAQNKIIVDIYSVADPAKMCAQMLQPFEADLPMGSFPAGHYTVWVDGRQAGEFGG